MERAGDARSHRRQLSIPCLRERAGRAEDANDSGLSPGLECGLIYNPWAGDRGDTRHTREDGEAWWQMVPGMASLNSGVNEWHGSVAASRSPDAGSLPRSA